MKRVLFIDVRNAMRSQIAQAWFNYLAKDLGFAQSCGTMPANQVDPRVVTVMQEAGLDISHQTPRGVNQQMLAQAGLIVLMGKDIYPEAFAPTYIWDFRDPGDSMAQVRELRDRIRERVLDLLDEIRLEELDTITNAAQWRMLIDCLPVP